MSLSKDFVEFIEFSSQRGVEYLLVGGHAVAFHGWPRFTKDIDFWIKPTEDNARRLLGALDDFGFGGFGGLGLDVEDFSVPGKIVQLGVAPNRIDLITKLEGLDFDQAWRRRVVSEYAGSRLMVLNKQDLITNKRAVGRDQDLLDLKKLQAEAKSHDAK
jgi:hypothetical protein